MGAFKAIYSWTKNIFFVGTVYIVGYMGWSIFWLIILAILYLAQGLRKRRNELRKTSRKASGITKECVVLESFDHIPPWSKGETCEWVNKVIGHFWPTANQFAKDLINDIPSNFGFKLERIELGSNSPRIESVKIYKQIVELDAIIFDMELFYESFCDVRFNLASMKGGIKNFQIQGSVRMIIKPLNGKLEIFFLNNPNIDFKLDGVVSLFDMPGITAITHEAILNIIAGAMVSPNKLEFPFKDKISTTQL